MKIGRNRNLWTCHVGCDLGFVRTRQLKLINFCTEKKKIKTDDRLHIWTEKDVDRQPVSFLKKSLYFLRFSVEAEQVQLLTSREIMRNRGEEKGTEDGEIRTLCMHT